MRVPYNYLPKQFENPEPFIKDWRGLIKSSDFTLGRYVEKFENEFAKYIGAKFCIATNNGTDALILSLKALNIGVGDEVITVCNSFYATTGAIVAVGALPVFVDCDERYQIDITKIERAITANTKAILPVHWFGASPDMHALMKIAKKYSLRVIEDACMGIGGKFNDIAPGNFGDCGAYSMHPLKSLNVMGDGGMVTTNSSRLYTWMRKYRNHGMIDRDNIEFWGVNMRIQPFQAIVASRCIKQLDKIINKRNKNAKLLDKLLYELKLDEKIKIPPRNAHNIETQALYVCQFDKRDDLLTHLLNNDIEAKIHYPKPLHLQNASKLYGYKRGDFPVAEQQALKILTLPIHQFLNEKQIKYMANKINEFYSFK